MDWLMGLHNESPWADGSTGQRFSQIYLRVGEEGEELGL
jgi:hypothetical protein